jgi:hypothetical protein
MQMDSKRVTIELPIGGSGEDYAGAIALAIADAICTGDKRGAAALIGLMSKIKLPAGHNAQIELDPGSRHCRGKPDAQSVRHEALSPRSFALVPAGGVAHVAAVYCDLSAHQNCNAKIATR